MLQLKYQPLKIVVTEAYAHIKTFGPLNALLIRDCSYIQIDHLEISAFTSKTIFQIV